MLPRLNKKSIKILAGSLADEMARRFYYKMLLLKFLQEIKEIEGGKKALKGKEIDKFLTSSAGSR